MATTTNYGWTTPDDTALVKDGASAIRTLGSSVDTTTKALNPSTTLGDIEYRSSTANTNTRLGIGSTGQVLTVAGGVPSWAAAGSAADFALINAGGTALTGAATITVNVSGKNQLYVRIEGASSANVASSFLIRLNADSGANYIHSAIYQLDPSAPTIQTLNSTGGVSTPFGVMGNDQTSTVSGHILISGTNATGVKPIQLNSVSLGDNTTNRSYSLTGSYLGSSAITSISLLSNSGNFDAGTIYVYGA